MHRIKKSHNFAAQKHDRGHAKQSKNQGEMAEWSIAAVLKTVEGHTSGGSNPSLSAISPECSGLYFLIKTAIYLCSFSEFASAATLGGVSSSTDFD